MKSGLLCAVIRQSPKRTYLLSLSCSTGYGELRLLRKPLRYAVTKTNGTTGALAMGQAYEISFTAGRNQRAYLIQSYARDMGNGQTVMMREITWPVFIEST